MRGKWKYIAGMLFALLAIFMGVFCVRAWWALDLAGMEDPGLTTFLYDRDGQVAAAAHGGENRVRVTLEELPEYVKAAFLAAEDARFYRHFGVDVYRILGAAVADLRSGSLAQGASTITQQLVKLTQLSAEKTFSRKIREAVMAVRLETVMEKDQILEKYLNLVYFGAGAYGIQTAAQTYFSKDAKELTVGEAALLAGILKSPSAYSPHLNPEKSVNRRNMVLKAMREQDFIGEDTYQAALEEPLQLRMGKVDSGGWYADAAMEEASCLLDIEWDVLARGGYHIYTGLDAELQHSVEALFADETRFPSDAEDGEKTQAALTAIETETGRILALVGGREYQARGFNRATDMRRQPGSAFKPISVYAAAVDAFGYLPTSSISDEEKDYGGGYVPRNASGEYHGVVTLRQALASSMNAAAVELISVIGVDAAAEYAQRLGVPLHKSDSGLSLALGALTEGVTPTEMAAAYCALANGGFAVAPHLVTKIVDRNGNTVYEAQEKTEVVLREESAYWITSMLETAAQTGTAKALACVNYPVAAKTGTVGMEDGSNRDAWTVAYTPELVLAVWMGFDRPDQEHSMAASASGGSYPARLAAEALSTRSGGETFPVPSGLSRALLDKTALEGLHLLLLASRDTPSDSICEEFFPVGKAPQEISTLWQPPQPALDGEIVDGTLFFTALSPLDEYVIYQDGQEIAALRGAYGQQLSLEVDPLLGRYEIAARNVLLYQAGINELSPKVEVRASTEKQDKTQEDLNQEEVSVSTMGIGS